MPEENKQNFSLDDHNLVITLNTKMDMVLSEIKDIKDNSARRIEALEKEKADQKQIAELWARLNDDKKEAAETLKKYQEEDEKWRASVEAKLVINKTWIKAYSVIGSALVALLMFHIFYQPK